MGRKLKYDFTHQTIGRLKVLRRSQKRAPIGQNIVYWDCVCECGKSVTKTTNGLLSPKNPPSCGCVGNPKNRKYQDATDATLHSLLRSYKREAGHRKLEWQLTFEAFVNIIKLDCCYCGQAPQVDKNVYKKYGRSGTDWIEEATVKTNGVDRIDNGVGYVPHNCVPCCSECNYAKRKMSVDQFLNWINRVYNYQNIYHE